MKGGIYMAIFYAWKHKRINILIGIIISCMLLSGMELYQADQTLSMYSGSYALIDGDTGRLLKGKEATTPMANASTTKILTCIVTLEHCDLNDVVMISKNAASQPKVKMGIQEGAQYSLKDLVYGLMLESYNDCAVAIAEHVAGSTEKFAHILNEKAKEIGCTDTYFITPNGLDAEDENSFHHTTAEDLCRIMAYCTWESPKKELFLEITQTRNYGSFVNRNAFLNQMEGVLTGKTGFTNKAGYCYVAAMEKNGEKYCIALLACGWPNNKDYKWKDARVLFEYGLENYNINKVKIKSIKEEMKIDGYVEPLVFSNINRGEMLSLYTEKKEYQVLMAKEERLTTEIVLYTDTVLPIQKGQVMGQYNIYLDNMMLDSIPIIAKQAANIWGWKMILHTIFYRFLTFSS